MILRSSLTLSSRSLKVSQSIFLPTCSAASPRSFFRTCKGLHAETYPETPAPWSAQSVVQFHNEGGALQTKSGSMLAVGTSKSIHYTCCIDNCKQAAQRRYLAIRRAHPTHVIVIKRDHACRFTDIRPQTELEILMISEQPQQPLTCEVITYRKAKHEVCILSV